MIIPTDYNLLLRDLAAYAFDPDAPAEVAQKIQMLQGTAADRLSVGLEMLYAFRDQLDIDGLTILGQLAGFVVREGWHAPGEPTRYDSIYQGVLRDLEGAVFDGLEDPAPQKSYRTDSRDWREAAVPNLEQLKAAKRRAVNDLRDAKQNGHITTTFGVVDGDDGSKLKVNGMVTMALIAAQNAQPFEQSWTMADNTEVLLDGPSAIQMGVEVGQFVGATHTHALDLKGQIDAVTVVDGDLDAAIAELDAIDITGGWPT